MATFCVWRAIPINLRHMRLAHSWKRTLSFTVTIALTLTSLPMPQRSWAAATAPVSTPVSVTNPVDLATFDPTSLTLPEDLGTVEEIWKPTDHIPTGLVIHIQDLHTQPEAQRHLSELIGYLHEQLGIQLVALEGAEGLCDTTPYSDFPDPTINERIARLFLQEGLFTGSEYYAITHPGQVTLWGAEDEPTYLQHLQTYQQGAQSSAQAKATLQQLQNVLKPLQTQLYPKTLHRLLNLREAYRSETQEGVFRPYLQELLRLAKEQKLNLSPHLQAYVQAESLYPRLDMRLVEADRDRLLRELRFELSVEERRQVRSLNEQFAAKEITEDSYYEQLAGLAHTHHIPLPPIEPKTETASFMEIVLALAGAPPQRQEQYHALRQYLTYVQLTASVHSSGWRAELEALEDAIEDALLSTEQQRSLAKLIKQLSILDELLNVRMTPDHHHFYQEHRDAFAVETLWNTLDKATDGQIPVSKAALEDMIHTLPTQEHFYELALKRDEALVRNTMRQLETTRTPVVILIAGGFHTTGITQQLQQRNIAYIVIAPKATGTLDETAYHAQLQNELPPITELLRKLDSQTLISSVSSGSAAEKTPTEFRIPPDVATDRKTHTKSLSKRAANYLNYLASQVYEHLRSYGASGLDHIRTYITTHPREATLYGIALGVVAGKVILSVMGIDFQFDQKDGLLLAMATTIGKPPGSSGKPQGENGEAWLPPPRFPHLLERLRNGSPLERVGYLVIATPWLAEVTALDDLLVLLDDADSAVRRAAITALAPRATAADEKSPLIQGLARQLSDREPSIQLLAAYVLRQACYGERVSRKVLWQDSLRIATPTEIHHGWLGFLHAPSHNQFLTWLRSPLLQSRVQLTSKVPEPIRSSAQASREIVLSDRAQWLGRSIIEPDERSAGATIYKVARPTESLESLNVEASLWNRLYNEKATQRQAKVLQARLRNFPPQGALPELTANPRVTLLRYHVEDIRAVTTYPLDWRVQNPVELTDWLAQSVGQLAQLARLGWGYRGLLEYYHDVASGRRYDLAVSPVGCLDDYTKALRFANVRAQGRVVDLSPEHMVRFEPTGPTASQFAEVLRDQAFQLALVGSIVAFRHGFTESDTTVMLRQLGHDFSEAYQVEPTAWEAQLPLNLSTVASEMLEALRHPQGPGQTDLGFDNGVFSAPSLVAYAETISSAIVSELLRPGSVRGTEGTGSSSEGVSVPAASAHAALQHLTAEQLAALRQQIHQAVVEGQERHTIINLILPQLPKDSPIHRAVTTLHEQLSAGQEPDLDVLSQALTDEEQVLLALLIQPGQGGGGTREPPAKKDQEKVVLGNIWSQELEHSLKRLFRDYFKRPEDLDRAIARIRSQPPRDLRELHRTLAVRKLSFEDFQRQFSDRVEFIKPSIASGPHPSGLRSSTWPSDNVIAPPTDQYHEQDPQRMINDEVTSELVKEVVRLLLNAIPGTRPERIPQVKFGSFSRIYRVEIGEEKFAVEVPSFNDDPTPERKSRRETVRQNALHFNHYWSKGLRRFVPEPHLLFDISGIPIGVNEFLEGYEELNFGEETLRRWVTAPQNRFVAFAPGEVANVLTELVAAIVYHYEPNLDGGTTITDVSLNNGDFIYKRNPDGSPAVRLITIRDVKRGVPPALLIKSLIQLAAAEELRPDEEKITFPKRPTLIYHAPVLVSNPAIAFEGVVRGLTYRYRDLGLADYATRARQDAERWVREFGADAVGRGYEPWVEKFLSRELPLTFGHDPNEGQPSAALLREFVHRAQVALSQSESKLLPEERADLDRAVHYLEGRIAQRPSTFDERGSVRELQPRQPSGQFDKKPGGDWKAVLETILATPVLLELATKGELTITKYRDVDSRVSESTNRRDFASLVDEGYLIVDTSTKPRTYRLTDKAEEFLALPMPSAPLATPPGVPQTPTALRDRDRHLAIIREVWATIKQGQGEELDFLNIRRLAIQATRSGLDRSWLEQALVPEAPHELTEPVSIEIPINRTQAHLGADGLHVLRGLRADIATLTKEESDRWFARRLGGLLAVLEAVERLLVEVRAPVISAPLTVKRLLRQTAEAVQTYNRMRDRRGQVVLKIGGQVIGAAWAHVDIGQLSDAEVVALQLGVHPPTGSPGPSTPPSGVPPTNSAPPFPTTPVSTTPITSTPKAIESTEAGVQPTAEPTAFPSETNERIPVEQESPLAKAARLIRTLRETSRDP